MNAARWLLMQLCGALFFFLFMAIPVAAAGYQPDLMVRLAADGDAAYLGSGLFETTASVQTVAAAAFQGTPAQFRVLLKNAGELADSFLLKGTGSGNGFSVRYLDDGGVDRSAALSGEGYLTPSLAPGQSLSLLVQVTPAVFTPGASFRVIVSAVSSADSSRSDQVKSETVACGASAAVTVSAPADGAGLVGSVVSYPYTVTNVGSGVNAFTLSATTANGWATAIRAGDGSPTASSGPLAPGASYRFSISVAVPSDSANGDHVDTRLTVAGEGTSGTDDVTTTALAATVSVAESVRNITQGGTFQPAASAFPGDTVEYRMSITNSGSAAATAVSLDSPVPANSTCLAGTLWIGTSAGGDDSPCAAAECGIVRESTGSIVARLGQGATSDAGGSLTPGKTLYVYFRVKVN